MARLIQKQVKEPLSEELLFGKLENGGTAKLDVKDNEFIIECTSAAAKKEEGEAAPPPPPLPVKKAEAPVTLPPEEEPAAPAKVEEKAAESFSMNLADEIIKDAGS